MVKLIPTLLALSASLATVFAHRGGYHQLEKRQNTTVGTGCPTTYAPIAAGAWPFLDCTPFVQDPQVVEWLKLVDMTKVPVYPQSKAGVCPTDLTTIPAAQCWWTCQKCDAPDDITSCPKTGQWGLTYDGTILTCFVRCCWDLKHLDLVLKGYSMQQKKKKKIWPDHLTNLNSRMYS